MEYKEKFVEVFDNKNGEISKKEVHNLILDEEEYEKKLSLEIDKRNIERKKGIRVGTDPELFRGSLRKKYEL